MSTNAAAHSDGHGGHGHDDHGDHGGHGHDTAGHGTRAGYLIGFFASVVLTAIPFWLVMGHVLPNPRIAALVVMAFGAVQVVVHMIYFLHMNTKAEGGWTILALIFTLVLVGITLTGSVWVMFNLNENMMPSPDGLPGMQGMPGMQDMPGPHDMSGMSGMSTKP